MRDFKGNLLSFMKVPLVRGLAYLEDFILGLYGSYLKLYGRKNGSHDQIF